MSVKIVIEVFFMIMSLWSAHLAGAMYYKSIHNPSLRLWAIARSVVSVIFGILALAI
jgi:hypothetical protein